MMKLLDPRPALSVAVIRDKSGTVRCTIADYNPDRLDERINWHTSQHPSHTISVLTPTRGINHV